MACGSNQNARVASRSVVSLEARQAALTSRALRPPSGKGGFFITSCARAKQADSSVASPSVSSTSECSCAAPDYGGAAIAPAVCWACKPSSDTAAS